MILKRRFLMRLKSLWIDGFKNLNDFKIDFESRDGITVLIGNNASGKSNILEAISAIFAGLYNENPEEIPFKFNLIYRITNLRLQEATPKELDIRISKKLKVRYRIKKPNESSWKIIKKLHRMADKYSIIAYGTDANDMDRFWVGKDPFDYRPSQIIALYSGEELRLWENYYQKPYFDYNEKSLKSDSYLSKQKMLYINKYYWDIALLTMIASDIDIKEITPSQVKTIKLKIDIDKLSGFLKSKPNNVVNNFVWDLAESENIPHDHKKNMVLDLDRFKEKTGFKTHSELFDLLRVARLPKDQKHKLITDLELKFENGTTTKDLSEGQKKQILLKLALEVLAGENSLLLFDEPDAHIHIANKKLIPEMLKEDDNREIVLTTHSPTLAHSFDNKHLAYLDNGEINIDYNSQNELLNSLTGGLMGVSEQQIFLQSNKDILIVEGKTDEMYIFAALKVLKEGDTKYKDLDFNFLWLGGTDADTLNKIIKSFTPKENQTIIAFFDREGAGLGCIRKALDFKGDKDSFKGEIKDGVHIYLYPKKNGFTQSIFEVEDYFPIEVLEKYRKNKIKVFKDLKQTFNKVGFAEECQKASFEKANFDGFKQLFNKILEIKNQAPT